MIVDLDLAGAQVVIVGGGPVAARKAEALLRAGARVRVISPDFAPAFGALAVERVPRPFAPGDTEGAALIVSATGDRAVDAAVAAEARAAGRLVSVAGAPDQGNLHFTAEVQRGPVAVAVATGGASPTLARRLRDELERSIGPEWGELADLLAQLRERLSTDPSLSQADRAAIYRRIVEGSALDLLRAGRHDEARAAVLGPERG